MRGDRASKTAAQRALCQQFTGATDARGYVAAPADNLLDGVSLAQFEADLRSGDGSELDGKFCAIHSSSALAVNTFAWFKTVDHLPLLSLCGIKGAKTLSFERRFPIFRGGRAPNLDAWFETDTFNIAIESKLTEYLVPKRPTFSPAYDRLAPPTLAEPCWWQIYEQAKTAAPGYLDIAQLVKHYFGLRKHQQTTGQTKAILFLYLYWEPLNAQTIPACQQHQQELTQLTVAVQESAITFRTMTYSQLWSSWSQIPELAQHALNLKNRYEVGI